MTRMTKEKWSCYAKELLHSDVESNISGSTTSHTQVIDGISLNSHIASI